MSKLLNFKKNDGNDFISICAPMVRYSKLPFRLLVRELGCDLAYTPMIIADSFLKSDKARYSEFTTCAIDRPLIVQFASRDPNEFLAASKLIYPYADGVDLNCGCPQKWAIQQKIGCSLMKEPQLISEIIKSVRLGVPDIEDETHPNGFSVSAKVRICEGTNGTSDTVELLRRLDRMGVDWVTIHARTAVERSEPARWEQLGEIVAAANVSCGLVVNGDVTSIQDAQQAHKITGCQGVMSARGILSSPSLFSSKSHHYNSAIISPFACAKRFVELGIQYGCQFSQIHQHLYWMLEGSLSRCDRVLLHSMSSSAGLINLIDQFTPDSIQQQQQLS